MRLNDSETLGTALPKEIERCQELLPRYAALGPPGALAHLMIKGDIARAHKAMMEGDVAAMIQAYKALRGCQ